MYIYIYIHVTRELYRLGYIVGTTSTVYLRTFPIHSIFENNIYLKLHIFHYYIYTIVFYTYAGVVLSSSIKRSIIKQRTH